MNLNFGMLMLGMLGAPGTETPCALNGTWKSDRELTMAFIENHVRLEEKTVKFLREIMGYLVMSFDGETAHLHMPDVHLTREPPVKPLVGFDERSPYELLYCSEKVAVVAGKEAVTGNPLVSTYNFPESGVIWVYVGNVDTAFPELHIREYFRKVEKQ